MQIQECLSIMYLSIKLPVIVFGWGFNSYSIYTTFDRQTIDVEIKIYNISERSSFSF